MLISILVCIRIHVNGSNRAFLFRAHDSDIIKEWIHNINEHIKVSIKLHQTASPTTLIMQNKFWKYDTIPELEFLDKADTGDLLLFRTK